VQRNRQSDQRVLQHRARVTVLARENTLAFYTRGGGYVLRDVDKADPEFYAIRADQPMSLSSSDALPDVGFRCAKDL